MFRLLGLRYDQRDIYNAYLGITGDDPFLRSSAVEFVDNLLDWKNSRLILPLLDDPTGEQAAKLGSRVHGVHLRGWSEAVTYMLTTDDPRLNVLGLAEMGQPIPETLRAMKAAVGEQTTVPSEVAG